VFLQQCFYLVDGLRVLLPEDLVGDDPGEHMGGEFQAEAGRGKTASVRRTMDAISDTVASYAI
jgi:hypothetical protein